MTNTLLTLYSLSCAIRMRRFGIVLSIRETDCVDRECSWFYSVCPNTLYSTDEKHTKLIIPNYFVFRRS
jgi:hypothetical protein